MTGEAVFLDLDGEVKQQALFPERPQHTQELQSVGLRHPQQRLPLWDPIAVWITVGFTAGRVAAAAGVVGGGQTVR